jgi:PST family polysaccharide transporter
MPYLVRVLGPGKYGALALAQAVMEYLENLTDYGFNMTATRIISIERDNPRKIAEVYSNGPGDQIGADDSKRRHPGTAYSLQCHYSTACTGLHLHFWHGSRQCTFPYLVFPGDRTDEIYCLFGLCHESIFYISIFFVIKNESDYVYVPLLTLLGYLGEGIAAQIIIYQYYGVRYVMPTWESIVFQVKDGFSVFISTLANSFYVTMPQYAGLDGN